MNYPKSQIARNYMLSSSPFVHGMASAFDMFAVLNRGRNEQLLANLHMEFRLDDGDIMRSVWQSVGETLYLTMKQHDLLYSGNPGQ